MKVVVRDESGRQRFIDFVKNVNLSKPFTAIFEPVKKKRSLPQNRLFHMWMQILENDTGTSYEAWKEYYKKKFLTVYTDKCFNETTVTVQGTSELDTVQFTNFLDKVRQHAAEEGYYLPLPGDLGYDDMILKFGG